MTATSGSVHPRLSVSALSSATWTLIEDLAFWQDAEISAVGLSLKKLEDVGLAEAVDRVLEAELTVTNLLGLGFDLGTRACWPAHQDRLLTAIDAAVKVGAGCFVLTTGPAGSMTWEDAAERFEEAVVPLRVAAAQSQLPLAIEHTHSLRVDVGFVHTLRDALALADRTGMGVLLECNACWAERGLASTIAARIGQIRLVQVSDYRIGTHCTPDRLVPGDGDIPLRRIIGQLLEAGYSGVFDLELIGPHIEAEGYACAIQRSLASMGELLTELGA